MATCVVGCVGFPREFIWIYRVLERSGVGLRMFMVVLTCRVFGFRECHVMWMSIALRNILYRERNPRLRGQLQ